MSDSHSKNHWQALMEQLGIATPQVETQLETGDKESAASPLESQPAAQAAPGQQPEAGPAVEPGSGSLASGCGEGPPTRSAGAGVAPVASSDSLAAGRSDTAPAPSSPGASRRPSGFKEAGPESPTSSRASLRSHWSMLARSLGLPISIDVPVAPTGGASSVAGEAVTQPDNVAAASGSRSENVSVSPALPEADDVSDLLAYERPPVEPVDDGGQTWRAHQGEFDATADAFDTYPDVDVPLEESQEIGPEEADESQPVAEPAAESEAASQDTEFVKGKRLLHRRPRRRRRRRHGEPAGTRASPEDTCPAETVPTAEQPPTNDTARLEQSDHGVSEPSSTASSEQAEEHESAEELHRARHAKIPTWEQAVGYIIDHNLAQRARSSSESRRGWGSRH